MEILVRHKDGFFHNAHRFGMVLGAVHEVVLVGVEGRIAWSATDDEVLQLDDDNGAIATVTATSIGTSTVTLVQRNRTLGDFHVEVYQEPTVTVGMTFGNVRDREK